jgi:tetratricopeptide (TPR) repeat protein
MFAQAPDKPETKLDENPAKSDPEQEHAIELYKQGKFVSAMPLFEKLMADRPTDAGVRESFAYCVVQYAGTLSEPELRRKARIRARKIALEAKSMGDTSQLLQVILETPEDGTEPTFSDRTEVNEVMKSAEADFSRGDLDKARQGYERAFLLDPKNYDAALFIGDVYFKQHVLGSAGEWFAQAIKINPNRETAYRYWGDALAALGKDDDARAKYIEAVVAEPYVRSSSVGLTNWLQHHKLALNTVQLKDGATVSQKEGGGTNITMNISVDSLMKKGDPATMAWIVYGGNRSLWHGDKFKKEFPNEPAYRRTLREESESLGLMVNVLKEQKDYKKTSKHLDPSFQELIKIQEAGLLEPFVLFSRVDADIAKDYAPFRDAHRENVRRYVDEFLVPKTPDGDHK